MKWVLSRFRHDISYLSRYTNDYVLYDRSEEPLSGSIVVSNRGSDIADKFTFIIDNYDNLPEIAVYTKANIFKYVSEEEFEAMKETKDFTPILTQNHKQKMCDWNKLIPFCFYLNEIYYELNNYWYLQSHPVKDINSIHIIEQIMGTSGMPYVPFAPGSNYIVPKKNILKHPKSTYETLRKLLMWNVYPGEAMLMERGLLSFFSL